MKHYTGLIDKYRDRLPVAADTRAVSLNEGATPLIELKNLPALVPTDIVDGREARVHRMPPGPDRWKERSRTYVGIAAAMAAQWG